MKRSGFTEDQIIGILKEHGQRAALTDFHSRFVPQARRQRRSGLQVEAKYGGMNISEVKRLKGLEDENVRLKRLLADAMLDNAALKDLLEERW